MQKTENNSRRNFLKMIPIAMVSIGAFSFLKAKKSTAYSEDKYHSLTKSEADEIVKNENFPVSMPLKPSPVPLGQKSTM